MVESNDIVEKLIRQSQLRRNVQSTYQYYADLNKYIEPRSILGIFSLQEDFLTGIQSDIYQYFEKKQFDDEEIEKSYNDLKWKLSAFINIQDVFIPLLFEGRNTTNIFHMWYFYYESKYILLESILAGFQGYHLSSDFLLRLFLEFTLLQNYYFRITDRANNYSALEKYLEDGLHPKWSKVLSKALPNDPFCKPIKKRIEKQYKALSSLSAHPYHPKHSPKQIAGFIPEQSLEGIFFWHKTRIVLQSALWCYYANFPMLFQPLNPIIKFGFNGPVGIFVDEINNYEIKMALSESDFTDFKSYSDSSEFVQNQIEHYNSLPDLSEKQIRKTWNQEDGEYKSFDFAYCMQMSKMRAMKEMLALRLEKSENAENDIEDFDKFNQYSTWKKIYKNV